MKGFIRTAAALFLLCFISRQILWVGGDAGGSHSPNEKEENPTSSSIPQRLIRIFHVPIAQSPLLEKFLGFIKMVQRNYFPPNLDFRSRDEGVGGIKMAAEKSLGMGKETVEESAKTAVEAVQKTAGKVKESVGDGEEEEGPNPEL